MMRLKERSVKTTYSLLKIGSMSKSMLLIDDFNIFLNYNFEV